MAQIRLKSSGMRQLLKSGEIRAALQPRANAILAAAKASAPVETGAYRASLHLENDSTDRARTKVVASDEKAYIVESKFGVLSRAADAGGR